MPEPVPPPTMPPVPPPPKAMGDESGSSRRMYTGCAKPEDPPPSSVHCPPSGFPAGTRGWSGWKFALRPRKYEIDDIQEVLVHPDLGLDQGQHCGILLMGVKSHSRSKDPLFG